MNMPQNEPEIIEAEIVKNGPAHNTVCGEVSPLPAEQVRANEPPSWHTPGDHARPYGDRGGMFGGFLVLAMGFIVTAFVLLFSVCVIIPLTILMHLFGVHKRR